MWWRVLPPTPAAHSPSHHLLPTCGQKFNFIRFRSVMCFAVLVVPALVPRHSLIHSFVRLSHSSSRRPSRFDARRSDRVSVVISRPCRVPVPPGPRRRSPAICPSVPTGRRRAGVAAASRRPSPSWAPRGDKARGDDDGGGAARVEGASCGGVAGASCGSVAAGSRPPGGGVVSASALL